VVHSRPFLILLKRIDYLWEYKKGVLMRKTSLKMTIKRLLVFTIMILSLLALTGCTLPYGLHRHFYGGRYFHGNADHYNGNYSAAPAYVPGNRGHNPIARYGPNRSGNCTW